MDSWVGGVLRLLGMGPAPSGRMLGGFIDSLLQTFENSRAGLSDEALASVSDEVPRFFSELYEKEHPRLVEIVTQQEQYLDESAKKELIERVDERVRKVVLPAYTRLARRFTKRERNDFYLVPEALHGLERALWAVVGMGLGAFAVWAPFIPVWEKEWILPFTLAGLVFPNVRRFFALRRYQAELNALVTRTDDEIWRMDLNFLTGGLAARGQATIPIESGPRLRAKETDENPEGLPARLEDMRPSTTSRAPSPRRRVKEGEG